eukprot:6488871-Amphidinium_carterae.4
MPPCGEALLDFRTLTKACQLLCTNCNWSLEWYEVEDIGRPIQKLFPKHVTCVPNSALHLEAYDVWPPKAHVRASGPKRARVCGGSQSAVAAPTTATPATEFGSTLPQEAEQEGGDFAEVADEDEEAEEEDEDEGGEISENLDLLLRAESLAELFQSADTSEESKSHARAKHPGVSSVEQAHPKTELGASSLEHAQPFANADAAAAATTADVTITLAQDANIIPEANVERPLRGLRGRTGVADAVAYFDNGRISYYCNKSSFEAVCSNPKHGPLGSCNMTRTSKGRLRGGVETEIAGRPLGFLAHWIDCGAAVDTKEQHKSRASLEGYSYVARLAARQKLLERQAGRDLSAFERAQHVGEEIEPATLYGYI